VGRRFQAGCRKSWEVPSTSDFVGVYDAVELCFETGQLGTGLDGSPRRRDLLGDLVQP
jgi:hypothetical protein